jgi:hypothetical protein
MKTLIIYSLIAVLLLLYVGELKVSTNPFCVELPRWRLSIAVLFFMIAIIFYREQAMIDGAKQAVKCLMEIIAEQK